MQIVEGFSLLDGINKVRDLLQITTEVRHTAKSLPEEFKKPTASLLSSHKIWLTECGLSVTASLASKLAAELSRMTFTPEMLYQRLLAIEAAFQTEFGSHLFLHLDQSKKNFYHNVAPFGAEVFKRFPGATFDIDEAGRCYALERPTACVLHLMRVLEVGLSVLAQSLRLRFNEPTWNLVLNTIEKKIKIIEQRKRKPKDWKSRRQFYSEVATDFRFLKDAWRNYAMHARQKYSMKEARNIYNHVDSFMQHLALKLKE